MPLLPTDRPPTDEAAIFLRVWDGRPLTPEIARHVLRLAFSEQDKGRMHELAVKNQEGALTPEEARELDSFLAVGDLLAILQSRARAVLRGAPSGETFCLPAWPALH
jgi:hypothetical protein